MSGIQSSNSASLNLPIRKYVLKRTVCNGFIYNSTKLRIIQMYFIASQCTMT